jgi:hypothetical protein
MNITTKHLQGNEMLEVIYALNQYSPPFQNKDEWMKVVRERKGVTCHAVLKNEMPVSVAVSTAMPQNMRGGPVPCFGCMGSRHAPIGYERLGYVSFPLIKIAKLSPASLAPLLKRETGGEIDLKLIGDAYEPFCEYLIQMRDRTHGMGLFEFSEYECCPQPIVWIRKPGSG